MSQLSPGPSGGGDDGRGHKYGQSSVLASIQESEQYSSFQATFSLHGFGPGPSFIRRNSRLKSLLLQSFLQKTQCR